MDNQPSLTQGVTRHCTTLNSCGNDNESDNGLHHGPAPGRGDNKPISPSQMLQMGTGSRVCTGASGRAKTLVFAVPNAADRDRDQTQDTVPELHLPS